MTLAAMVVALRQAEGSAGRMVCVMAKTGQNAQSAAFAEPHRLMRK